MIRLLVQLQAGRLMIRSQEVNIRETLHRVALSTPSSVVQLHIADSVPAVLETDGVRFAQVLNNGLSNAVKHTLPNTPIVITCFSSDASSVTVEITNKGAGLHGLDPNTLFEPYERGRDEASSIPGTGLGLPISRLVCAALNLPPHSHGSLWRVTGCSSP